MAKRRREQQKRNRVFVVRLWAEKFDDGRRVWRGEVVDAATDTRRYFGRWEELLAFLSEAIDVPWEGDVTVEIRTRVMGEETAQESNERPK